MDGAGCQSSRQAGLTFTVADWIVTADFVFAVVVQQLVGDLHGVLGVIC